MCTYEKDAIQWKQKKKIIIVFIRKQKVTSLSEIPAKTATFIRTTEAFIAWATMNVWVAAVQWAEVAFLF